MKARRPEGQKTLLSVGRGSRRGKKVGGRSPPGSGRGGRREGAKPGKCKAIPPISEVREENALRWMLFTPTMALSSTEGELKLASSPEFF